MFCAPQVGGQQGDPKRPGEGVRCLPLAATWRALQVQAYRQPVLNIGGNCGFQCVSHLGRHRQQLQFVRAAWGLSAPALQALLATTALQQQTNDLGINTKRAARKCLLRVTIQYQQVLHDQRLLLVEQLQQRQTLGMRIGQ